MNQNNSLGRHRQKSSYISAMKYFGFSFLTQSVIFQEDFDLIFEMLMPELQKLRTVRLSFYEAAVRPACFDTGHLSADFSTILKNRRAQENRVIQGL